MLDGEDEAEEENKVYHDAKDYHTMVDSSQDPEYASLSRRSSLQTVSSSMSNGSVSNVSRSSLSNGALSSLPSLPEGRKLRQTTSTLGQSPNSSP